MSQTVNTTTPGFHQYYLDHDDLLAYENGPGYARFHEFMFGDWFDNIYPAQQDNPPVIAVEDMHNLIIDYFVYPKLLNENRKIVALNNQLDNLGINDLGQRDDIEGEIGSIITSAVKDKAEQAARFVTLAERNGRFTVPFISGDEHSDHQPTQMSYWMSPIARALQDFNAYRLKENLAVAHLFSRSSPDYNSDNDPKLYEVYDENPAIQSFCALIPEFEYQDFESDNLSYVADKVIQESNRLEMPETNTHTQPVSVYRSLAQIE